MYEQFPELMNMLWTRMLKDNKKNWRRVYKVCIYMNLEVCRTSYCSTKNVMFDASIMF